MTELFIASLVGLATGLGLHVWACWRLLSRMTGVPLLDVLRGKRAAGGGPTKPTGPV